MLMLFLACCPRGSSQRSSCSRECRARTSPQQGSWSCHVILWFGLEMLKPRLLGIFLLAAAAIFTGAEFALARDAREIDVSVPLEWKNQIIADLEHNKRYLSGTRTRGRDRKSTRLNSSHLGISYAVF